MTFDLFKDKSRLSLFWIKLETMKLNRQSAVMPTLMNLALFISLRSEVDVLKWLFERQLIWLLYPFRSLIACAFQ